MYDLHKKFDRIKRKSVHHLEDVAVLIMMVETLTRQIEALKSDKLEYAKQIAALEKRLEWYRNCTLQVVGETV